MAQLMAASKTTRRTREWIKEGFSFWHDFRVEYNEAHDFYAGVQWDPADIERLKKRKRPYITINKIRPLVHLLSGFQRLNRYEPDFKPRTADDLELCKIRKGITKYIFDRTRYNAVESRVFMDGVIGGLAWAHVGWEWNFSRLKGEISISRVSPLDILLDPDCLDKDLKDALWLCRLRWVSKQRLISTYPEYKQEIEAIMRAYDEDEDTIASEIIGGEPVWYDKEKRQIRVVETWYKKVVRVRFLKLPDGSWVEASKLRGVTRFVEEAIRPVEKMYVCIQAGELELEHTQSPYEHNNFPYVPYVAMYAPDGRMPQGLVADLKDIQREINKRRSQTMHIVNSMANGGWKVRTGSMLADQLANLKQRGADPDVVIEYTGEAPQEIQPKTMPVAVIEAEKSSKEDIMEASGINESLLGQQIPSSSSGRAIELQQRQSVTQIEIMFDNLREFKYQVLCLLWGDGDSIGLVQQYYNEEKTFRITSDQGKDEFVTVNQEMVTPWGMMRAFDITSSDFDVVISEMPATATQRMSQFYALVEMVKSGAFQGIPIADIIVEASDLPQKDMISERIRQAMAAAQQQAAQQAQMQQVAALAKAASLAQRAKPPGVRPERVSQPEGLMRRPA